VNQKSNYCFVVSVIACSHRDMTKGKYRKKHSVIWNNSDALKLSGLSKKKNLYEKKTFVIVPCHVSLLDILVLA
jgi:hypothetical protein